MVVGSLVRATDKSHLATIIKATRYNLDGVDATGDTTSNPEDIRPGWVVTVAWQGDCAKKSVHVFYDGTDESQMNFQGRDTIVLVK